MNSSSAHRFLTVTALASALLAVGGAAEAQSVPDTEGQQPSASQQKHSTTFVDLEAGLGFSSNPFLQYNARSTAFGRLSASGTHQWVSEKGVTAITGYVENTTYLRGGYGSKQIFNVGATTNQRVSETATVYGDLNFSGDFAGQLSNRLVSVPSGPIPVDPNNPLPTVNNPDLFGLSGRQYRLNGDVGASIRTGERGTLSLSAGAQRAWFTGTSNDLNYTSYYGSGGYSSAISERTSVGGTLYLQRQDFNHGDWANIINPVATISTRLSESLRADAAVGVMEIAQHSMGETNHSLTPSFSGSLCSVTTQSRFCGRVSRDAQSALSSSVLNGQREATVNTSLAADYFRRLTRDATLQASVSAVHYNTTAAVNGEKINSTYMTGVLGYDRRVGNRLYAGVQGGVRKLFQSGPDPKLDLNASVYLRYRLGDLL